MGSLCKYNTKYTEGVGNDHLTKNIRENMELSKYTRYRILVPHNNGNVKLTGLDGEQARTKNCKHEWESKFDIDINIDPSGDNWIVSKNNRSVTIDPGDIPWEENPSPRKQ